MNYTSECGNRPETFRDEAYAGKSTETDLKPAVTDSATNLGELASSARAQIIFVQWFKCSDDSVARVDLLCLIRQGHGSVYRELHTLDALRQWDEQMEVCNVPQ